MSEASKANRVVLQVVGFLVLLAIIFSIVYGIIWVVQFYWNTFLTSWKEKPVQVILTAFLTTVGLGLALFKRWSLQSYAMLEISFGFNFLWQSTDRIIENPGNGTVAIASAYVLARGFNNLFDSWRKIETT